MKKMSGKILLVVIALLFAGDAALATDGYFLTGYGRSSKVRVALELPSLETALRAQPILRGSCWSAIASTRSDTIPASALWNHRRQPLPPGYPDVNGTYDGNRVKNFELPELGYSLQLQAQSRARRGDLRKRRAEYFV